MQKSPIRVIRENSGLSRAEFAALLNLSYQQVGAAENAYLPAIPEAWRPKFESAGLSFDQLAKAYQTHKGELNARARLKLAASGGAA